jgi:DNA polymerase-3 subunit epsilon
MIKPVMFFDLETTGVDIAKSRIVQYGHIIASVNGVEEYECISLHVDPECEVPAEAAAVHGLTNEKLSALGALPFREHAEGIWERLQIYDIGGYNIAQFDLPILQQELLRVDSRFRIRRDIKIIDAYSIFSHFYPRTLAAAHLNYVGVEIEGAHSALADANASLEVFRRQLKMHNIDDPYVYAEPKNGDKYLDFARCFVERDGEVLFNFGKHKGMPISKQKGYLEWMLKADFTRDTVAVVEDLLALFKK